MQSISSQEPLFAEERRSEIVRLAALKGKVLVPELAEYFGVSAATIRGDLRELEQSGFVRRTHGGAMVQDVFRAGFEPDHKGKVVRQSGQKRAIALKALEFVEDGDILILDTGTTTLEMARLLAGRRNVTVVVNDLEIAACLEACDGITVVLIGGSLRKQFQCTVGPFAVDLLSELNVDKAFMATNSLSLEKGCTTPDIAQAEVKKAMIGVSAQTILLCDSSKWERNAFVQFAPLPLLDLIITDSLIDPDIHDKYTGFGCEIVIADAGEER